MKFNISWYEQVEKSAVVEAKNEEEALKKWEDNEYLKIKIIENINILEETINIEVEE